MMNPSIFPHFFTHILIFTALTHIFRFAAVYSVHSYVSLFFSLSLASSAHCSFLFVLFEFIFLMNVFICVFCES